MNTHTHTHTLSIMDIVCYNAQLARGVMTCVSIFKKVPSAAGAHFPPTLGCWTRQTSPDTVADTGPSVHMASYFVFYFLKF